MNTNTAVAARPTAHIVSDVLTKGDLSKLTPQEKIAHYNTVCETLGLNPYTQPFMYITLQGREVLYARKDATDQLRNIHGVSVIELTEVEHEGVVVCTAKVVNGAGRTDMSKGAVAIAGLRGEARANAIMKAETKAKRRATLSLCGLGFLDESEVDPVDAGEATRPAPHRPALSPTLSQDARSEAIEQALPLEEQNKREAEKAAMNYLAHGSPVPPKDRSVPPGDPLVNAATGETKPHAISRTGLKGWNEWCDKLMTFVTAASTAEIINDWTTENFDQLAELQQRDSERAAKLIDDINNQITKRIEQGGDDTGGTG